MYQTQYFSPIPYQMPMQYPMQGQYQPQYQAVPQVNAVKIDINNPQAYGGTNGASSTLGYPNASMYSTPFSPIYAPQMPQFQPQQIPMQTPQFAPIAYAPQINQPQQIPNFIPNQVAPQIFQPVINPQVPQIQPMQHVQQAPQVAQVQQTPQIPAQAPIVPPPVIPVPISVPTPLPPIPPAKVDNVVAQTPVAATVAEQPKPVTPVAKVAPVVAQTLPETNINVSGLTNDLASSDLDKQTGAIQKIAELAQADTNAAKVLLVEPVFNKLIGIINADTSKLQGPTGKTSDPKNLSPLEKAEINKQFAIYTLAILQKNFREEINKEMKKNNLPDVAINDLPYIKDVVNNLKDNPNPTIREACLSALNYIGKPEDKSVLKTLYEISAKHDASPSVKAAANNYLSKIG